MVEQRAGRPAEAEQDFRRALGLDPVHAVAMVRWGDTLLALGRAAEAEPGAASRRAPSSPGRLPRLGGQAGRGEPVAGGAAGDSEAT